MKTQPHQVSIKPSQQTGNCVMTRSGSALGRGKSTIGTAFGLVLASCLIPLATEATADVAIARCGSSDGQAYFFHDELINPEGPNWLDDGISNGKLILVRLGEEWDIQYGDGLGAFGYRQDGAQVVPLGNAGGKLTIGAFRGSYSDVFTFDLRQREVIWTSHKIGTFAPKVAIYRAECEYVAPDLISGE